MADARVALCDAGFDAVKNHVLATEDPGVCFISSLKRGDSEERQ